MIRVLLACGMLLIATTARPVAAQVPAPPPAAEYIQSVSPLPGGGSVVSTTVVGQGQDVVVIPPAAPVQTTLYPPQATSGVVVQSPPVVVPTLGNPAPLVLPPPATVTHVYARPVIQTPPVVTTTYLPPTVVLQNLPPGAYTGRTVFGTRKMYFDGQPVRNFLRFWQYP